MWLIVVLAAACREPGEAGTASPMAPSPSAATAMIAVTPAMVETPTPAATATRLAVMPTPTPDSPTAEMTAPGTREYLIQPGDTLVGIAQRYLGNRLLTYQLARYNGIEKPTTLTAGQTLRIPRHQVGTGAPRGRDLDIPGRKEAAANIHIGIDWLASVSFGHIEKIGKRVIVLGGGNTAMDCCRSSRRLGGDDVKVIVRSGFDEMKASPWEKEDAQHEGIPIINFHVPKAFTHDNGRLTGVTFEIVEAKYDANHRRTLVPSGRPDVHFECDDVLVAVGQENSFPWIERDLGLEFDKWGMPVVSKETLQSSLPKVFFGGDAAFGPKNIIWAVAHGHEAAISIDKFCMGEEAADRPPPMMNLISQKMGIHEWSYDNAVANDTRYKVPLKDVTLALKSIKVEVELGFDAVLGFKEAQRCLNCDVQTVFTAQACIECDACVDICPMDCITFTANGVIHRVV